LLRVVFGLEWKGTRHDHQRCFRVSCGLGCVKKKGWIQGFWPTPAPGGEPKGGARRT